jgi:Cys-tRNA(Pro)/Cys-tRNA(Cys) deacylase
MVPGDRDVDLRVVAREIGAKSVHMAAKADAERWTGLQTGGIGALALLGKRFEVCIDRLSLEQDRIYVNGGRRGLNLELRVADLIAVTRASPISTS